MARKYKATGCARFFLFLLIFGALVYFGLNYLDQSGNLDKWRDKIESTVNGQNNEPTSEQTRIPQTSDFDAAQIKRQMADLLSKIEEQKQIIADQERTIKEQQAIIEKYIREAQLPQQQPRTSESSQSKGDQLSLEELIREAEKVLRERN